MDDENDKQGKVQMKVWKLIILLMTMILLYAFMLWKCVTSNSDGGNEVKFAFIVTSSIVVCIISFVLASMILKNVGIGDNREALGLPPGSIRSFIALILICVFFIISIIMYNGTQGYYTRLNVSKDVYKSMTGNKQLLRVDVIDNPLLAKYKVYFKTSHNIPLIDSLMTYQQDTMLSHAIKRNSIDTARFEVYVVDEISPNTTESNDFAKAFQTGFMTLISAICAFYFGTKSATDAAAAAASKPNPKPNPNPDPNPNPAPNPNIKPNPNPNPDPKPNPNPDLNPNPNPNPKPKPNPDPNPNPNP